MKVNYNYIKAFFLLALVIFLFGFAGKRNEARVLKDVQVKFTDYDNLYLTEEAVNKLLIVNNVTVTSVNKETLDLNRVENVLNAHEMIENAEVYLTLDGILKSTISQRRPIGRILGDETFYVDRLGNKMPLSPFYSARVPVLGGVGTNEITEVYPLLDYISKDLFLQEHITAINRLKGGFYELEVRKMDFRLFLGKAENLETKFNNFKAFYKKAHKDDILNTYKMVDLQFGNQVVCTKK
ncbi:cell division protein FtsQ [soil metagenome]